ncbi:carboxylesterase/lipase family protein [Novosphingobium kaempferiae]|uniref:carboxylesterase/lipase family protein n=1 Tax=Novosphingobium kaempferiae TaxID=2896849 RepID=UPI001E39A69A|nr:carboxylesterase family protein [Novosphingobium kaempferiae]
MSDQPVISSQNVWSLGTRRRSLLSAAAGLPFLLHSGSLLAAGDAGPIVETTAGRVRGLRQNGCAVFRGVPYAGGVSGRNRFRAAGEPVPWAGIRDAIRPGPPSIQLAGQSFGIDEPAPGEDCLTLTIWTPAADGRRRPVMVYSHGGGFATGSAASVIQDGTRLARENDVVVVATNHRLGLLGFLYLDEIAGPEYAGSGCNGVRDIAVALRWIAGNIERFGGDPDNVMIFGESGGGAKTSCLYAMPEAVPYFHKASIESGPGIRMTRQEEARETTARVLSELGIAVADWRKLLDVPASDLLKLQLKLGGLPNSGALAGDRRGIGAARLGFGPVVDGYALPTHPFDPVPPEVSRHKPLIVGHNRDEFTFFGMVSGDREAFSLTDASLVQRLRKELPENWERVLEVYRGARPQASPTQLYVAIRSARFSGIGATVIAERKAAQHGAPVFAYRFDYQLERKVPGTDYPLGAMHALDIAFKFDNVDGLAVGGAENFAGARADRIRAGRNMSGLWAAFARSGVPSVSGQPRWPAYDLARRATMLIDAECTVVDDPDAAERRLWASV